MTFTGDFGGYAYDSQWPPFDANGMLGGFAPCAAFDASRAFIPFFRQGNQPAAAASQRHAARIENERLSRQVRAGLLLLLASCGWIVGGEEGAQHAVTRVTPAPDRGPGPQHAGGEHFSVRALSPSSAPELFAEIDRICWRAKLPQRPRICLLIGQRAMNAYAFGSPEDAVVTFTEGLLRGMTTKEVAAIFAHEIAHICNGDSATMSWAAQLQRAINDVSAAGLAPTRAFATAQPQPSLYWLLERAPAIAELLLLALSRFREVEADAFALDLTGDHKTLVTALSKLEHQHRALSGIPDSYVEDRLASYLRSHPVTSERICNLRASTLHGAA